jgi:membrane protein DedA with SNARE-associated domain
MALDILVLLSNPSSLIYLFFLTIFASWVIIPTMGLIIVSFGAAATSIPNLISLIILFYIATIIGDISIYFVARRFSRPVLKFLRRFRWFKKNEEKARPLFKKYGFYAIFISRFLNTELCVAMNYVSGFEKFNYKKFILAVLTGEFIYAAVYPTMGYIFKDTWGYILGLVRDFIWMILIISGVIYLIYKITKIIKSKNANTRINRKN